MTSDSSSEDEDTTKLLEALDGSFINNSMYANLNQNVTKKQPESKSEDAKSTETHKKQISLRPDKKIEDDEFNFLNVTQEFKNFVAKNLTKLLDNEIDLYTSKTEIRKDDQLCNSGGIKLFSNSPDLLKDCESYDVEVEHNKKIRKIKGKEKSMEEDINMEARIKAAAVSPDDILSQKDTVHWSLRTKRKPFVYKKLSNGKLELVE